VATSGIRANATRATIPPAMAAAAPTSRPARGPAAPEIQPISGPPIGLLPRNTTE
jgi:hypothetical protein